MSRKKPLSAPMKKFISMLPVFIVIFSTIGVVTAGLMFYSMQRQAQEIKAFETQREKASSAAEQFENGSATLTYESKMYCETEDMSHFKAYVKELTEDRNRDAAVQALFRMGLSTREISRIQDAKIASDDLSNREVWAMELVALSSGVTESELPEGLRSDVLTEEEKNLTPEEQYSRGYQYIMGASYFTSRYSIDSSVREFSTDLMQRYGQSAVEMTNLGTSSALVSFTVILILVSLTVLTSAAYSRFQKENAAELSDAMEKARSASRAKSDFLSNMSHDIRTPMNAIVGMTNMAMQSMQEKDYGKVSGDLKIVQSSSRQLLSLINDVLDLSKIESGKMMLANEPYAIPLAMNSLNSMILPLCIAKSQDYRIHYVHLEHEFVIGDEVRLRQVMMNLLNNASKYTPNGGRIDFYIEERPSETEGTGLYEFRVRDNGIGIAKDKLENVFEPFTREVNTTVNQVEGTGLGLAIVRSVLDARGGTVRVESEKGKGSQFIVTVALKIQDSRQALARYADLRGKQILVMEEEKGASEDVYRMLKEADVSVECTDNLEYALKMVSLNKNLYLLVLIDREKDPFKVIQAVRNAAPKQSILFLACEGKMRELEEAILAAGADAVLEKPVFRSVLYSKILENIRGENTGAGSEEFLTGKRILITDDVAINRMVAKLMFEHAGAAVEQAESGREAVDKFLASEKGYYDAIMMDIMMPGMGGYEATALIRQAERSDASEIPIVAMTANAFSEDIEKSLKAGMNGYINKPIEMENVRQILTDIFKKKTDGGAENAADRATDHTTDHTTDHAPDHT